MMLWVMRPHLAESRAVSRPTGTRPFHVDLGCARSQDSFVSIAEYRMDQRDKQFDSHSAKMDRIEAAWPRCEFRSLVWKPGWPP
jgi:hypothetical protein